MSLSPQTKERIESVVSSNRVVLFMKGTPAQPQCGFSARTIGILNEMVDDYETVNVLADQEMREGIKAFSDWPTVPQLYVDGEFQGGCDLVTEMYNRGDLHSMFGREAPDRTPPVIEMSDGAVELMRGALDANPGMLVHLSIDAAWEHNFNLGPAQGHEIRTDANGIEILVDLPTAQRARGLKLDVADSFGGNNLTINNPNMPPPVQNMDVDELHRRRQAGEALELVDVRTDAERNQAMIADSALLDGSSMPTIEALPKDATLVFYCHTGVRSAQAAEHFRKQGFMDVHNLTGGIDAWSKQIDSSVPVY
jgi:monothiol glutaredoxin